MNNISAEIKLEGDDLINKQKISFFINNVLFNVINTPSSFSAYLNGDLYIFKCFTSDEDEEEIEEEITKALSPLFSSKAEGVISLLAESF